MDRLSIDVIEGHLGVPLIAPERIHELDAKEIAAALGRLDEERIAALEETEDAWEQPGIVDETNRERLAEILELIEEAIDNCETCRECGDDRPCARCASFKQWLGEA
jgi:hypothetical protein